VPHQTQYEWRALVWASDGTPKSTITPDDAVLRIDSLNITPANQFIDYGEATITAVGALVSISPRDVVRLDTREVGAVGWVTRYLGVCTLAGSPRSAREQTFRFAGLRQRLRETLVSTPYLESGDAASFARAVLSTHALPYGVTYSASDFPDVGMTLGDRYPQLESIAALLDAICEANGAFVVPSGESYAYAGVTYTAAQAVPALAWGVDSHGVWLHRNPAVTLALSEDDYGVRVEWGSINAEDTVDRVRLVYATGFDPEFTRPSPLLGLSDDPKAPTPVPLARAFTLPDSDLAAELVAPVANPRDFMTNHITSSSSSNVTNPANAFDEDPVTYAEKTADASLFGTLTFSTPKLDTVPACILYIDALVGATAIPGISGAYALRLTSESTDHLTAVNVYGGVPPEAASARRQQFAWLLAPPAWTATLTDYSGHGGWTALLDIAEGTRVYDARLYVPDVDVGGVASAQLARSFMRPNAPDAAVIERAGLHLPYQNRLLLTPHSGSAIELVIERVEVTLSPEEGAITRYHVGSPFDGALLAQRAVLQGIAEREARKRRLP
jgi:hypothetical protein